MMRILAAADLHGRDDRISRISQNVTEHRPDVLVLAGDITGRLVFDPARVMGRLAGLPVPVVAVLGNADAGVVESLMEGHPNAVCVHLREVTIKDVPFVGINGAPALPFLYGLSLFERRVKERLFPLVCGRSVVVAHPPPSGSQDSAFGMISAGSKSMASLVASRKPALVICGHVHENPGFTFAGPTCVVNCSVGKSGGGALIDLEDGRPPSVRML
jgi:Icc-related predicted phosphoesterase